MQIYDTDLGVKFDVPDKLTVLQALLYDGALGVSAGNDLFVRLWEAAKTVITNWECERIPDLYNFNLHESDDMQAAEIVQFVGLTVKTHTHKLRHVPKN